MEATQRILIGAAAVIALHAGPEAQNREKRPTPPSEPTPLVFSASFDNLPADQLQRPNGTPDPNWTTSEASVNLPGDGIYGVGNFVPHGGYGCPTGSSITTAASRSGAPGDRGFRFCMVYNPTINPNADGSNKGTGGGVNQGSGGLGVNFTTSGGAGGPFREIWFQWWQRYGTGLRPQANGSSYRGTGQWSYVKDLAFNNEGEKIGRVEFGWSQGGDGQWGMSTTIDGGDHYGSNKVDMTWRRLQGGIAGSGKWNKYQIHVKADTGKYDGVFEAWVDGVLIASHKRFVSRAAMPVGMDGERCELPTTSRQSAATRSLKVRTPTTMTSRLQRRAISRRTKRWSGVPDGTGASDPRAVAHPVRRRS